MKRLLLGLLCLVWAPAFAAEYPIPREADWIARDFRFHTGEVMPELRLHYTTIGNPAGEPVLLLHGTGQSGAGCAPAGVSASASVKPSRARAGVIVMMSDSW